jgi:type I restriction enzyme S subunit
MAEFPVTTLGEVAYVRSGFAFKSSDWKESGIPVVKIANVKSGRLNMDGCSFVDDDIAKDAHEFQLEPGDILIAMTGYIGEVAVVRETDLPALLNQRVGRFSIRDPRRLDREFLYYVVTAPSIRQEIEGLGYGSAQPNVSPSLIQGVSVPLPPIAYQRAIASTLGALDSKIDLNRRMNETLEAMARAIFKDWFVDFGPTRAKMEGRAPYLGADIWSLFPDRLDDDGKPDGWSASTIGQEVEVVGGSTPSTKEAAFWGGEVAWATPKDLSSLSTPVLLSTERQITEAGLAQIASGLLPVGTVLLSSRAPIGYMAIAQIPVAVNQGFIAMICNKQLSNVFVWLWTHTNMETVHQNANGSTFQEISKASFRPIEVIIATPEILRVFNETVRPLFARIVANEKENRSLAATRDFLLPKLMTGEVRVKEAEKLIGEVA